MSGGGPGGWRQEGEAGLRVPDPTLRWAREVQRQPHRPCAYARAGAGAGAGAGASAGAGAGAGDARLRPQPALCIQHQDPFALPASPGPVLRAAHPHRARSDQCLQRYERRERSPVTAGASAVFFFPALSLRLSMPAVPQCAGRAPRTRPHPSATRCRTAPPTARGCSALRGPTSCASSTSSTLATGPSGRRWWVGGRGRGGLPACRWGWSASTCTCPRVAAGERWRVAWDVAAWGVRLPPATRPSSPSISWACLHSCYQGCVPSLSLSVDKLPWPRAQEPPGADHQRHAVGQGHLCPHAHRRREGGLRGPGLLRVKCSHDGSAHATLPTMAGLAEQERQQQG